MALVMVQGHVFDALVTPEVRNAALYQLQVIAHGSTAPGFLFASGFVAGLPRAPLSLRAGFRRARRLLFVLGVGYALHLPYFSLWKTLAESTAGERAALFACDALQVIAVTQIFVLVLQALVGRHWTVLTGLVAVLVLVVGPAVWGSEHSTGVPAALGAYLDDKTGSRFPIFPFSAFVLAGTVAGAALGRQEARVRRRRCLLWGTLFVLAGVALAFPLAGVVDFWGVSPAYALLRIGGLLLLLQFVERMTQRRGRVTLLLALLGRQTLLVFVFHLYLLFGWVGGPAPLGALEGCLSFLEAMAILVLMVPVLLAVAGAWHRARISAPQAASLLIVFATTFFVFEFFTSPW